MSFGGWTALEQPINRNVTLLVTALDADGRIEAFVTAALPAQQGTTIWHIWQGGDHVDWSDWAEMGTPDPGFALGAIGTGLQNDGRLKIFTEAGSQIQTQPNTGWSGKWQQFFVSAPPSSTTPIQVAYNVPVSYYVVVHESNSNMNVFGIQTTDDPRLARTYQTNRYFNNFHGWALIEALAPQYPQGVTGQDFDVASNQDGRMEAFVRMSDDCLWHAW
jgi:hypothetical protein